MRARTAFWHCHWNQRVRLPVREGQYDDKTTFAIVVCFIRWIVEKLRNISISGPFSQMTLEVWHMLYSEYHTRFHVGMIVRYRAKATFMLKVPWPCDVDLSPFDLGDSMFHSAPTLRIKCVRFRPVRHIMCPVTERQKPLYIWNPKTLVSCSLLQHMAWLAENWRNQNIHTIPASTYTAGKRDQQ